MNDDVKLSHTSALILRTVHLGYQYGFDIMEAPACLAARSILHCGGWNSST